MIPRIDTWASKKHGDLTYRVLQAFTGHGSFGSYRKRIGRKEDARCYHCEEQEDNPEHSLFSCPAFAEHRLEIEGRINGELRPDSLGTSMLRDARSWQAVVRWIEEVMKIKEEEEWRRQRVEADVI